ncbi:methylenetetrahydrofolate reductase C-terminal domain-containing protein [Dissulfurimicrobium hydrothermale]|uniref:methylenetetrahydrofolate reductase C-terminal domain-containing protein n=1 Tax=Dissulfurimicrobium hydrothermale TaxID=1750598 RepID=UPI001EDA353E|nr:methylenetetrahydrofolate reductase C-terminal domain-containing protein [Dissulfurimicrobium hydrothermale]UKL13536.1 methylenetetrahydrofolate reductase C-terminal domain-containing protein [Dissulfurimicrobium hydrothermale]
MKRDFKITFELVPARASSGKAVDDILLFAKEAAADGRISALSITDNAGGHPALSPKVLGQEVKALGIEPIIHFSCKDKNRNLMESELFELDRLGLRNLLVVTGDYPRFGFDGNAKPVFDMDSVQTLMMINEMNSGMFLDQRVPGGGIRLPPTGFKTGCVVSPFKRLNAEIIPQYQKLVKKLSLGPDFVVSQMGFDARKYDELKKFMDMAVQKIRPERPPLLLGTVFIPTVRLSRIFYNGDVPGCTMPKRLLDRIEVEAEAHDHGLQARLERGARLTAVLKGIGYDGVHLSGPQLRYEHIAWLIKRAEEISNRWTEFVAEFLFPEEWEWWYFKEDRETGLNSLEPNEYAEGQRITLKDAISFWFSGIVHKLAFDPHGALFEPIKRLMGHIDKNAGLKELLSHLEYTIKSAVYECQECGDCTLDEMAFICPQSQCAKFLTNGPCGGSRNGWCEVWPGKKRCLYVRIHERLTSGLGQKAKTPKGRNDWILPPRDWSLHKTSSWLNFYLNKDHHGRAGTS